MIITPEKFNKLSLDAKGEIVFQEGKFLGMRYYYNQKLCLYSVGELFFEVWYLPDRNAIGKIEILEDLGVIDRYIDANQ